MKQFDLSTIEGVRRADKHMAKHRLFTHEEVLKIRQCWHHNNMAWGLGRVMARQLGITSAALSQIVNRTVYKPSGSSVGKTGRAQL